MNRFPQRRVLSWVLACLLVGASGGCFSSGGGASGLPTDALSPGPDAVGYWDDTGSYVGPGSVTAMPLCAPGECGGGSLCADGVCVLIPPEGETAVTVDPASHIASGDAPALGCVFPSADSPEAPSATTLYGAVTRFGGGGVTKDVRVEVFLAADFDPSACEAETDDGAKATCYARYGSYTDDPENAHGPVPVGVALSVAPGDDDASMAPCVGHQDCPLGYQCFEDSQDHACFESFGLYEIEGVPTNVPLVVRSRATVLPQKWHDTYVFNVVLFADQVVDGRVHYDFTMVSHGQWLLTPNTVNLGDVLETRGIVGGRIRDCRAAGVRDSWPVAGVSVGLVVPARRVVYFNDLEDDTVPLIDRLTTNLLGRFAALDIAPGWNRLAGVARIDGEPVSVGATDIYVFPNALSVVTWPGMQPHWSQQ